MKQADRRSGPLALTALGVVTLALLGGCAPHLVPLHGQTEAQTRIDQRECAEYAHAAGETAYLQASVWETDSDEARQVAYDRVHKQCITERGYRMKGESDESESH